MLIDSAAYPHILERIIWHCSAKTLVAFRSASKRCQQVADARLFHHAVLLRRWYDLRERKYSHSPLGLWRRYIAWRRDRQVRPILGRRAKRLTIIGLDRNHHPYLTKDLVVSPASGIESDMTLPLLPWKVHVLDLEGDNGRKLDGFLSVANPSKVALEGFVDQNGHVVPPAAPRSSPLILRRFPCNVRREIPTEAGDGTIVDFCDQTDSYTALPDGGTQRYVRNLEWCDEERPYTSSGQGFRLVDRMRRYKHVDDATLVLAQHSTPPIPDKVRHEVVQFARAFAAGILQGNTLVTIVGLDVWLPGADDCEMRDRMLRAAREADGSVRVGGWGERVYYGLEESNAAYCKVRFLTHDEYWHELGELQDALGVWPVEHQDHHRRWSAE